MKKMALVIFLFLSLIPCVACLGWAGGVDDANTGLAAEKRGDYDEAIRFLTKAIESNDLTHNQRGTVYGFRGLAWAKKGEYDKAITDFTKAIELDPRFAPAYANRGTAWGEKGEHDKAIADFNKALEIDPSYVLAYYGRGVVWGEKSEYNKAIANFDKALELDPWFVLAYSNRGLAWAKKGEYDKAMADLNKAIEIDPKERNGLAWFMATCPDDQYRNGKQAVKLAEKALEFRETVNVMDTLAAAYAEVGRFQDAIKTQKKAIEQFKQESDTKELEEMKERLESYKAGKPWREK